jgi:hypothetical protein
MRTAGFNPNDCLEDIIPSQAKRAHMNIQFFANQKAPQAMVNVWAFSKADVNVDSRDYEKDLEPFLLEEYDSPDFDMEEKELVWLDAYIKHVFQNFDIKWQIIEGKIRSNPNIDHNNFRIEFIVTDKGIITTVSENWNPYLILENEDDSDDDSDELDNDIE